MSRSASHLSTQALCTQEMVPLHLHGDINDSFFSTSWHILQNDSNSFSRSLTPAAKWSLDR